MDCEREIIERCQAGHPEAIALLIDRYQTPLYSLCRKLTRNAADADDLFQDTWVRVVRSIEDVSPERRFSSWLFAICVNRYRDRHRKRQRWSKLLPVTHAGEKQQRLVADAPAGSPSAAEEIIRAERREAVRAALDRLEDAHRVPLVLHYFKEFTMAEIGDMLSIPPGTVKSRLAAARRRLRQILEEQGYG